MQREAGLLRGSPHIELTTFKPITYAGLCGPIPAGVSVDGIRRNSSLLWPHPPYSMSAASMEQQLSAFPAVCPGEPDCQLGSGRKTRAPPSLHASTCWVRQRVCHFAVMLRLQIPCTFAHFFFNQL